MQRVRVTHTQPVAAPGSRRVVSDAEVTPEGIRTPHLMAFETIDSCRWSYRGIDPDCGLNRVCGRGRRTNDNLPGGR